MSGMANTPQFEFEIEEIASSLHIFPETLHENSFSMSRTWNETSVITTTRLFLGMFNQSQFGAIYGERFFSSVITIHYQFRQVWMPGFGTAWNSWMIIENWWEHISGVWIDIHKSRHIITDAGKVADVLSFCDKMLGEPSQLFSWLLYSQELFNGDSSLVMLLLIQLIITRIPVWIGLVEQQLPNFAEKDIRQKIWRWNYHKSFIFYGNFYDFNQLLDPTLPWSSDWRQFIVCNFPLQIFVCHAKLFCLSWVTFKSWPDLLSL